MLQFIGYAGSVLIAVSLSMQSLWKLRWINLVGAIFFTYYGWQLGALPVVVVNGYIAIIDIYYIWRMTRQSDFFHLEPLPEIGDIFLLRFMRFHEKDIVRIFPEAFSIRFEPDRTWLLMRNMVPVGIFAISQKDNSENVEIFIDYVTPAYQDFEFGKFIFSQKFEYFKTCGIKAFEVWTKSEVHKVYLKRIGFSPVDSTTTRGTHFLKTV
ncbi:MAG: hypothetical protein HQM08_10830 [Candidatus Riflebacteria bacterium]|nr:hypothetical protein [Candidatus Riflebacteria bacterium]